MGCSISVNSIKPRTNRILQDVMGCSICIREFDQAYKENRIHDVVDSKVSGKTFLYTNNTYSLKSGLERLPALRVPAANVKVVSRP